MPLRLEDQSSLVRVAKTSMSNTTLTLRLQRRPPLFNSQHSLNHSPIQLYCSKLLKIRLYQLGTRAYSLNKVILDLPIAIISKV